MHEKNNVCKQNVDYGNKFEPKGSQTEIKFQFYSIWYYYKFVCL